MAGSLPLEPGDLAAKAKVYFPVEREHVTALWYDEMITIQSVSPAIQMMRGDATVQWGPL